MAQDPICGRDVDESSRYSSEYNEVRYFFCSACCKQIFDAVPEEIAHAVRSEPGPGSGSRAESQTTQPGKASPAVRRRQSASTPPECERESLSR